MAQLNPYERETNINFNDEDANAIVYTCVRTVITKLDKLCKSNPDTYKLIKEDDYSKTYQCPKKLISFRSFKSKRNLTDEQRKNISNRMRNRIKKS